MGKCTDRAAYLKAARDIAHGLHDLKDGQTEGACDVLGHSWVGTIQRPDLTAAFRDVFVAGKYYVMDDVCDGPKETKAVRILALCFMAAMVEAGDA